MSDPDLMDCGGSKVWATPTTELRFIERAGLKLLQQKWAASAVVWEYGHQVEHTRWRWKDVELDANPERDNID